MDGGLGAPVRGVAPVLVLAAVIAGCGGEADSRTAVTADAAPSSVTAEQSPAAASKKAPARRSRPRADTEAAGSKRRNSSERRRSSGSARNPTRSERRSKPRPKRRATKPSSKRTPRPRPVPTAPDDAVARFIASGDAACANYQSEEEPARRANDGSRSAQLTYLGTVARLLDELAGRMRGLTPPASLEPSVREYVDGVSRLAGTVRAMRDAREAESRAYYERAEEVAAQGEESRRRARAIGFKICGT